MKKLLLILLLLPFAAFGQVTSWDTVQEGYYKVVVGEDTLEANFDRYDTALKVAYDSASSGKDIRIVQPDFRFEYELADIPVEQLLLEAHQTPDSATTVEYDSTGFVETFTFHTDKVKKKVDSMAFSGSYTKADFTNPASDLTDFVAVIDLSDLPQDWWDDVDTSDGTKGRAAKDDGTTELATEWGEFDDVNQTGILYVKWSGTLSATGTSTIRVYPPKSGNTSYSATDTFGSQNVWTSFDAVFHDGCKVNSLPGGDGVESGSMSIGGAAGKVGSATAFDQTDDVVDHGGNTIQTNSYGAVTLIVWYKSNDTSTATDRSFVIGDDSGGNIDWLFGVENDSPNTDTAIFFARSPVEIARGGTDIVDQSWHHVAATRPASSGGTVQTRVDGSQSATDASEGGTISLSEMWVGSRNGTERFANGALDELWIAFDVLSDDYLDHLYSNQNDPATFWGTWTYEGTATTLSPDSLSHNHTLESPVFESNYGLAPNSLQHSHSLGSPTFLSSYSLAPNGLQHGHTIGSPSFLSAYTLSAGSLQHSHSLESPAFTSLYTLAANSLQHGHSLESPSTTPGYTFSPNDLQHSHSLESPVFASFYELLANDLRHLHSLESPATTPGYLASPESLQHGHTLESTSISEAILLVPSDLSHGHTLEVSGIDVAYLLSTNGLQHTHNLSGSSVAVAYGLSANSLQHGHSLETPSFEVSYLIAPNDLQHAHSLEQAGLVPHYLFTPSDLQHNHALQQAVLSVIGEATMMSLSADELYGISLQDKQLYKITLTVTEENQNTSVKELYNISLQAKKQYIITLNANEVIE